MSKELNQADATPPKRRGIIKWIVAALLLMFAAAAAINLPRGYSDDLSVIGKGKAAVVLVRDKSAVQTFELLDAMNEVSVEYSDKVEFLLIDFDTPQGRSFMEANNAARATLVLFDNEGHFVKILKAPQSATTMRREISGSLGVN